MDPLVAQVEGVNVSDGESYCSEFRLQAPSSVSPQNFRLKAVLQTFY